jgi:hypothetical protein
LSLGGLSLGGCLKREVTHIAAVADTIAPIVFAFPDPALFEAKPPLQDFNHSYLAGVRMRKSKPVSQDLFRRDFNEPGLN